MTNIHLQTWGLTISRYGLALILSWFGIFKFTQTEAEAIRPLIEHHSLFNWMLYFLSIREISNTIGVIEIVIALAIALRPVSTIIGWYGSISGVILFTITISFMFTTPGVFSWVEWMYIPDGFLIKDILFLGFCIWSAGEARQHIKSIKRV